MDKNSCRNFAISLAWWLSGIFNVDAHNNSSSFYILRLRLSTSDVYWMEEWNNKTPVNRDD